MFLPNELIIQILENLDYRNLLICREVSAKLKDVVDGTASLQYIIELAVSGQKDGCPDPLASSGDRLNMLKRHQSAWRNMTWSREVNIPMSNGGLWELFGGVLGQNNNRGELIFHQLPSDLRGIEESTWTLGPDFGCPINDFAMDPHQDLLVLAEGPHPNDAADALNPEYRIHLRSLSTGKAHPLAKDVRLTLPQHGRDADTEISYTIQIFGEFVAILFTPEVIYDNQVAVWEWKTGRLLLNMFDGAELDSFSLLSYQYIVFALSDELGNPILLMVDLTKESPNSQDVRDSRSGYFIKYPPLDDDTFIHSLQLRADPGPICGENRKVPFFQDPKGFLLVLNMWISVDSIESHLIQFIPSQHLISLMQTGGPHTWMSQYTRMHMTPHLELEASDVWMCYVYGTRFAIAEQALNGQGELPVRLYDFNTLALRRGAQTSSGSDMSGSVVSWSNCIQWNDPFSVKVETSLPYWTNVAVVEGREDYDQQCTVMCCEDNIVIVDLESRTYRVLVF